MKNEISKTKIERRMRQKRNPILVNTIIELKKTNPAIAKLLVRPVKKMTDLNLSEIDKRVKEGETILVVGKILSAGDLTKKIKIVAWSASEKAKEKIKESRSEFVTIIQEMKKNAELKGVKLLE